jgi:hypothetical protein
MKKNVSLDNTGEIRLLPEISNAEYVTFWEYSVPFGINKLVVTFLFTRVGKNPSERNFLGKKELAKKGRLSSDSEASRKPSLHKSFMTHKKTRSELKHCHTFRQVTNQNQNGGSKAQRRERELPLLIPLSLPPRWRSGWWMHGGELTERNSHGGESIGWDLWRRVNEK